jgi:hypothetical protein
MLAAPRCWFCALACMAMVPSKSAAAVKVIVSFRVEPFSCLWGCQKMKNARQQYRRPYAILDEES